MCHQINNYAKPTCRGQSKHKWRWWTRIETTQADMLEKNPNYTKACLLGKNSNHKRQGDILKKNPNTKLQ
jgi:alpha-L-fucosidase